MNKPKYRARYVEITRKDGTQTYLVYIQKRYDILKCVFYLDISLFRPYVCSRIQGTIGPFVSISEASRFKSRYFAKMYADIAIKELESKDGRKVKTIKYL